MKILDEKSVFNFMGSYGNYNVNVYKQSRMIHKKNGCYCSKPYQFIPFDSIEEIKQFEKDNNVQFTYCQNPACGFKQ